MRKPARFKSLVIKYRVPLSILALCLLPWLLPSKALAVNVLIYGTVAVGYNLLFGYTGLLSFGHAAFVGTGAYVTGIAIGQFGVPWYLAVLMGVIGGALLAFAMGALSTRTRGIYFSMVTLALAQLVYYVALQTPSWTGGENGLRGFTVNKINLFGFDINFLDPVNKYYVLMVFAAASAVAGLAHSQLAIRRSYRGDPRERASCTDLRLQCRAHQAVIIHTVWHDLRAWWHHVGTASGLRAAGFAALPVLRHDRDDDAAGRRQQLLRTVHWCTGVPGDGRRVLAVDLALADHRRIHLRAVRAVSA
jgi:hypothetical protein